jgi:hypothetical protein
MLFARRRMFDPEIISTIPAQMDDLQSIALTADGWNSMVSAGFFSGSCPTLYH